MSLELWPTLITDSELVYNLNRESHEKNKKRVKPKINTEER